MEEEITKNLEIIVGTYEEYVLGYQLCNHGDGFSLKQCFANHSHIGSVRSVDSSSKFLATGGIDESVKLLNMKTRIEFGTLLQHDGTITSVEFIGDSHLATASEDGNICIFSTNNWQCQKTLRGHKKAVTSISVHPSQKLLLSVSKDKSLKTWNLVKGRSAYVTNIKDVSELVKWSPSGDNFAVAIKNRLDIYNTTQAGVVHTIDFGSHILTVDFLNDNVIVIGGETGNIQFHCLETQSCLNTFKAHEKRVKVLQSIEVSDKIRWLVSTSNDGFIKIWKLKMKSLKKEPKLVAETNIKCRPTCMAVFGVKKSPVTKEQSEAAIKEEPAIKEEMTIEAEPAKKKRKKVDV